MKFSNLINICLLQTVLIYTDALSIQKCKTIDCPKLSQNLTEFKNNVAIIQAIQNENPLNDQLKNKSNNQVSEKADDQLRDNVKNDEINKEFHKKSKRILIAHSKEPNNEQNLELKKHIKSEKVSTTPSNLQSSSLQLDQPSSQQKSIIQSNNQHSNHESTHQLDQQNNASNELKNHLSNSLEDAEKGKKKSVRSKREPRGRIGGGKASTSGTKRTKQDGTEVDDDSGSMTIKPFLCLVILSILFLFI